MPSFPIPANGIDFFYVDESASSDVIVMASVRIPFIRAGANNQAMVVWQDYNEAATAWRRQLSTNHRIKFRKELHGAELLFSQGKLHKDNRNLTKEEAFALYADALASLAFLPDNSIMATAATSASNLFGGSKMTASLTGLLQRMRRQCGTNTAAMVFFDEGHAEYSKLYRKAQKYLPVGSSQGSWPGGAATQNIPLHLFLEDGNQKSSESSYLVQMADLVAYAVLQKLKGERGELSQRRRDLGHHQLFDVSPWRPIDTEAISVSVSAASRAVSMAPQDLRIYTEGERREYEQERGYGDVSHNQPSTFLKTVRNLRTEAQELGRIVSWIQTDGPTSASDLADIRTVLDASGRAGSYGAGTFYLDKRRAPEHHRTRLSGPYEDLVLRKVGVDIFRYVLNTIEIDCAYRVVDSGRPMRPSMVSPEKR